MQPVLQSEAAECGLACLAMICAHHGNNSGLRTLRRRYPASLRGASLTQMIKQGSELGFACRPLRLEMDQLAKLHLPCILHWDLNHYVVLAAVGSKYATVLDPATGRRRIVLNEMSQHFTGIALEISPTAAFGPAKKAPAVTLGQLTGKVVGLWRSLLLLLILSLALQVFVLLAPFLMQWTVDHVLPASDRDLLTVLGLGFGLALLLQSGIGLTRGWIVIGLSARLRVQWSANVFSHLLRLPISFFEKRYLGDVVSRYGSVQAIQHTITTSFVEGLIDGLMAVVTLIMMLLYSWKLALVTLLAVMLYAISRAATFRAIRAGTELQLIADASERSHLLESIRGVQSLKIARQEGVRQASYGNLLNESTNRAITLQKYDLAFGSANQLIFGVERIAVIWIGALIAMQNVFSAGMLIAYLAYKDQFAQRVAGLIDKGIEFRMLRLHGERLADIALSEPEDQLPSTDAITLSRAPRIDVVDLSFRYDESEPWVLKNCSFSINPGESLALAGASGSGKTTLLKILLGLLPASAGRIDIDGVPLHLLGIGTYRDVVGAVMQDDQLFAGTIGDNIAFGEERHDKEKLEWAAHMSAVHDEISAMPMGYSTLVGDMGAALSGGQKQRIILARALYRMPKVLLLDEATSHLDVEREKRVNDAIGALNITRLIIAHRPETLASADRVIVLDHGSVVAGVPQSVLEGGHLSDRAPL